MKAQRISTEQDGPFVRVQRWTVCPRLEKMLGYANHVGLYIGETGDHGEALGNFPQAFTHLALINAVLHVIEAEAAAGG